VDLILLDWTRMGTLYCLAGVVEQDSSYRAVRPLLVRHHDAPVRNAGWSPYLIDGFARWDIFQLIGPLDVPVEPPHVEDVWVRSLRPRLRSASPAQRRVILEATAAVPGEPVFGVPLTMTHSSASLTPGTGRRSLATIIVPARSISFYVSQWEGAAEPDYRVALRRTPLGERLLPVKDHHLLDRAERAAPDMAARVEVLQQMIGQMGERVAIRLGLSRGFQGDPGRAPVICWLLADGFFSLEDPQP
jgi:hypothetical protein